MTATLTRTAASIACDGGCGTMLTGGMDTFGGIGEHLCFACFASPEDRQVTSASDRKAFLEKRKALLERWEKDAEFDRGEAQARINEYGSRLTKIERELTDGVACDEEDEDQP